MSYIFEFNKLIDEECNSVKKYLAIFPSSKYFYIREAIFHKTGRRLSFIQIKKLIHEEFELETTLDNTISVHKS